MNRKTTTCPHGIPHRWACEDCDQSTQAEPIRPDIIERLSYHALERDDLTLDDCLDYLASNWKKVRGRTERQMVIQILALLAAAPEAPAQAPIDMVLFCPACGMQHIDGHEGINLQNADGGDRDKWTNPPHRSHLCHGCGHIWRPADVPTNGVAAVKTKGKDDSPLARSTAQPTQGEAPSEHEALPTLPFAVFDEFGTPCEDRVRDHFRAALARQPQAVDAELLNLLADYDEAIVLSKGDFQAFFKAANAGEVGLSGIHIMDAEHRLTGALMMAREALGHIDAARRDGGAR